MNNIEVKNEWVEPTWTSGQSQLHTRASYDHRLRAALLLITGMSSDSCKSSLTMLAEIICLCDRTRMVSDVENAFCSSFLSPIAFSSYSPRAVCAFMCSSSMLLDIANVVYGMKSKVLAFTCEAAPCVFAHVADD